MTYQKIAICGATGNLGPSIVKALVEASFEVTLLSRSGEAPGLPSAVRVIRVDYNSQESIVTALKGIDAFVSAIPQHDSQPALIDAAIAAGVKRFIPSEFGSNISGNAKVAALPVFRGKKLTQDYLRQKSSQISWTLITNGLFLDWGIEAGVWANLDGRTRIFNGGNCRHSTTTLADVANAVVGVLKRPEETCNRAVYVQSAALSQNELLEIVHRVKPDAPIEIEEASTKKLLEDSHKQLGHGGSQIAAAMLGFIIVSAFDSEYGNLWSEENDNELLGITGYSAKGIEQLVASL